MPVIGAGFGFVDVQLRHVTLPRPAFLTFGIDNNSGSVDPVEVAGLCYTPFIVASGFVSKLDTNVQFGPMTVRLGQDGGEPLVGVLPTLTNGGRSGESIAPNCALLVHKRTARGGRRHRGRWFVPWIMTQGSLFETGVVLGTEVTTLQTIMTNLRTALATANVPMAVLHGEGKTAIPAPDLVTSLTVDGIISTQRRRLGR
jgi:hypothetical protein